MVAHQVRPVGVDPGRQLGGLVGHGVADAEAHVGHDVADEDGARRRGPRRPGAPWRRRSGPGSRSAAWSVRTRLCSSGMRRLKERRPASRWATGKCSFTARQRAGERGVRVAVDQHPVGAVLVDHRVHRREHAPRLDAVRAGADAEVDVRCGDLQVGEEDVRHQGVVVLAGVDDDVVVAPAASRAAAIGASFTNCGRAPTMLRTFTSPAPSGGRAAWGRPWDWAGGAAGDRPPDGTGAQPNGGNGCAPCWLLLPPAGRCWLVLAGGGLRGRR